MPVKGTTPTPLTPLRMATSETPTAGQIFATSSETNRWNSYQYFFAFSLVNALSAFRMTSSTSGFEYWDRFIRDEKHFNSAVNYILENPIKAGLVKNVDDWPWVYTRENT